MRHADRSIFLATLAGLAMSTTGSAATLTFDVPGGTGLTGSYTTPTNYTTNAVPTNADLVVIASGDIAQVDTAGAVAMEIRIANSNAAVGTLSVIAGGDLTVGTGTLGGNISVGRSQTAGATPNYIQTGGTATTVVTNTGTSAGLQNGDFFVSDSGGSVGRATISGGTLNVGDDLNIGAGGTGTTGVDFGAGANVNVVNQSGGQVNVASRAIVGSSAGSAAVYNLSGGSLTLTGTLAAGAAANGGGTNARDALIVGNSGTGTFNQSAGTVTLANGLFVGSQDGGTGTYNFSGGTLAISRGINVAAATNAQGVTTSTTNVGTFRVRGNAAGSSITANGIFANTARSTLGFDVGSDAGTTVIALSPFTAGGGVTTNVTSAVFDLDILAGSGYVPDGTTVYDLISTPDAVTGLDAPRPVSADGDAFDTYFVRSIANPSGTGNLIQAVPASLVPEPAAALTAFALAGLATLRGGRARRRRRRA